MSQDKTGHRRFFWIDCLKAIGIFWIFLTHVAEVLYGPSIVGHPTSEWTTFSDRLGWLHPFPIDSPFDVFGNFVRTVGWSGNLAVAFFLLASGFGLSWSLLVRWRDPEFFSFLRRRSARIFPLWWSAHLLMLVPVAAIGFKVSLADPQLYFSFIGVRITKSQFFYGIPAWWFIPLILQLYCVFPWLFARFRKGHHQALVTVVVIALCFRAAGLYFFDEYLPAWSCGAIFVSRLPEFVIGMWIAFEIHSDPKRLHRFVSNRQSVVLSSIVMITSYFVSLSVLGCVAVHVLVAIAGFLLAYNFAAMGLWNHPNAFAPKAVIGWFSSHTLSIFLVHHPIVWLFMRRRNGFDLGWEDLAAIGLALLLTLAAAFFLEWFSRRLWYWVNWCWKRWGLWGLSVRSALALATWAVIVLPIEISIRNNNPQDVPDFGWAERPSLQPDLNLGYRMRPSTKTRLRWESYDYVVTSNSDGFPAPEIVLGQQDSSFRIMTLGDAFTSAEGIDTQLAWPRRLESILNQESLIRFRRARVFNFGVTGYGPNQYAWIARSYVPKVKPDLIIIGFFTNDFIDVYATANEFEQMIGFDKPKSDSWLGYLTARHGFRRFRTVAERTYELVTGRPSPHTRFFCQCDMFERARADIMRDGQNRIRRRFDEVKRVADKHGAKVLLAMIPAPLQVVDHAELNYTHARLNLNDQDKYDYDQPQRMAKELADEFEFMWLDLRQPLSEAVSGPIYQSRNLHFTTAGHQVTAKALAPCAIRLMSNAPRLPASISER